MLPEWHLTENSLYVYMIPCEAHVLGVGIFLAEDRETQNIPLNYALNYAPRVASKGKIP